MSRSLLKRIVVAMVVTSMVVPIAPSSVGVQGIPFSTVVSAVDNVAKPMLSDYYSCTYNSRSGTCVFNGFQSGYTKACDYDRIYDFEIPSSVVYNGKTYEVVGVGDSGATLTNFKVVETVRIPSTVVSIGECAFKGLSNLYGVTLDSGSKLGVIGANAFYNSGVESINLESAKSLVSIGENAFRGTNLSSVIIPKSVQFIGVSAFQGVGTSDILGNRLEFKVTFESGSKIGIIGVGAFKDSNIKTVNFKNMTSLQSIGDNAFQNTMLSGGISFPTSLQKIGVGAFKNVVGEYTVNLDTCKAVIGSGAFSNSNIKSLILPNVKGSTFDMISVSSCPMLQWVAMGYDTDYGTDIFSRIKNTGVELKLYRGSSGYFTYQSLSSSVKNGIKLGYRTAKLSGGTNKFEVLTDGIFSGSNFDLSKVKVSMVSVYGTQAFEGDGLTELFTLSTKTSGSSTVLTLTPKADSGFSGVLTKSFSVGKFDLANADITLTDLPAEGYYQSRGANVAVVPTVKVVANGKTLVEGVDYTISFKNNTGVDGKNKPYFVVSAKSSDYEGTVTRTFVIKEDLSTAQFWGEMSYYNGTSVKDGTVAVGEKSFLKVGVQDTAPTIVNGKLYNSTKKVTIGQSEYTLKYSYSFVRGKTGACDIYVTVTAKDSSDFWCGSKTFVTKGKVDIRKADMSAKVMSKATVIGLKKDENGAERYMIERADGVPIYFTGSEIQPIVTLRMNGGTLYEGDNFSSADAYFVKYGRNRNVSAFDISKMPFVTYTATQNGYYWGSRTLYWSIAQADITDKECGFKSIVDRNVYTFTGSEIKSEAVDNYAYFNGVKMVEGVDYKVSYKNNVAVGEATVTIKGIGNFKGTKTFTFKIDKADLSECQIEYTSFWSLGSEVKPVPVLKYKGKVVDASEYGVVYFNKPTINNGVRMFGDCTAVKMGDVGYIGIYASKNAKSFKTTDSCSKSTLSSSDISLMQTDLGVIYMGADGGEYQYLSAVRKFTVESLNLADSRVVVGYDDFEAQRYSIGETTGIVVPYFIINGNTFRRDNNFYTTNTNAMYVKYDCNDVKIVRSSADEKLADRGTLNGSVYTYTDELVIDTATGGGNKRTVLARFNYEVNVGEIEWRTPNSTTGFKGKVVKPGVYTATIVPIKTEASKSNYVYTSKSANGNATVLLRDVNVETNSAKIVGDAYRFTDSTSATIKFMTAVTDKLDGNTTYSIIVRNKSDGAIRKTVDVTYKEKSSANHTVADTYVTTDGLVCTVEETGDTKFAVSPFLTYTVKGLADGKTYTFEVVSRMRSVEDGKVYGGRRSNVITVTTLPYSGTLDAVSLSLNSGGTAYDVNYTIKQPYTQLSEDVRMKYYVCIYDSKTNKRVAIVSADGVQVGKRGELLECKNSSTLKDGSYYATLVTKVWYVSGGYTQKNSLTVCENIDAKTKNNKQYDVLFDDKFSVSLQTDKRVVAVNEAFNITAKCRGGKGSYTYGYTALRGNGIGVASPSVVTTDTSHTFSISLATVGEYTIDVWVKNGGVSSNASVIVRVVGGIENKSTLSSGSTVQYKPIRVNFESENGVGSPTYKLSAKLSSDKNYTVITDYTSAKSCEFSPSRSGTYSLRIVAKDANGNYHIVYKTLVVSSSTFKATHKCSATSIRLGDKLTLSSSASGGTDGYQYAFYIRKSGNSSWYAIKGYSSTQKVSYVPKEKGTYEVCIKAKDGVGSEIKKYFEVKVS